MKKRENAGGDQVLARLGGEHAGLPFFAFVDSKGDLIVNANRPGGDPPGPAQNIGYPSEPQEIDWFMTMVRKAAPTISAEDAAVLEKWLRRQNFR